MLVKCKVLEASPSQSCVFESSLRGWWLVTGPGDTHVPMDSTIDSDGNYYEYIVVVSPTWR